MKGQSSVKDEEYQDDLLIEEQYRVDDLEQREALRAEVQLYLFESQSELTNEQINHAIQMIVDIDRKHQEIIIENFEKIEEVLDECQSFMAMTDIEDLAKIDLKDFKEESATDVSSSDAALAKKLMPNSSQ